MFRMLCFSLGAVLSLAAPASGQLPDFYKTVDRLVWVVEDLDKTIDGWQKLGVAEAGLPDEAELNIQFRGEPAAATVRVANGRFGDVPVHWIQPVSGTNAFSEFKDKHGSGIFSLVHRAPTREAYDRELKRLESVGVGVLQSGTVDGDSGTISYAFLDTQREGKYSLGLIYIPGRVEETPLAAPSAKAPARRVSQYAFAVRYLRPVSLFWEKLGFPVMSETHPQMRDLIYRGKPGEFDMELGWQRHGKVVYEWVRPLKGPNVYEEHLDRHGEGVHHLAFNVQDIDKEIARWTELGFPMSMGGAWGEKDKPGSGRFAYMDTHSIGGIDIELLWNYR